MRDVSAKMRGFLGGEVYEGWGVASRCSAESQSKGLDNSPRKLTSPKEASPDD